MRIGTSGFSFEDWSGPVYPEGTPKNRMFEDYVELGFGAVELNFTYYSMPYAKTMASFAERSGEDFMFSVKLNKKFTHETIEDEEFKTAAEFFKRGVTPLEESGKLGAILAQFPYSFKAGTNSVGYVKKLHDLFGSKLVAEFRNDTWNDAGSFEEILESGISVAGVDVPDLPGLYTNRRPFGKISYFRFHGRNKRWYGASAAQRYDYLYSAVELGMLADLIGDAEEPVYVFFNNCHMGQAARNALEFIEMF